MWKKCIAVAMAAVMAASMAACGSKPAETEAAKTEAAAQAGESKAEEAPADSAEPAGNSGEAGRGTDSREIIQTLPGGGAFGQGDGRVA